jgi:hypothetical protein
MIEERAREYADFICERFGVAQTIRMKDIVREALILQDAESRKAQRHACAEAASITVRQTRLVAGEYVSCEVADELARRIHTACINVEVKE